MFCPVVVSPHWAALRPLTPMLKMLLDMRESWWGGVTRPPLDENCSIYRPDAYKVERER
jgi:hypothetical protein